jgi:hypothetical protein
VSRCTSGKDRRHVARGAHGGRRFDHSSAQRAADSRGKTLEQLLDRNLAELLQELRVAFTGVQILFALLLGMAFTQRFTELDGFDIAVYVVALQSTALRPWCSSPRCPSTGSSSAGGRKLRSSSSSSPTGCSCGPCPARPGNLQQRPVDPRCRARPVAGDRGLLRHRASDC